ncbi:nitrite reductase/ring-hydroxylating ferredoxin subunit [Sediminihabitans luteus]|uniref:Cytochrome bc1 complex Rieske iron-sulfur subunit n=1 Tax=Sediminihabitans luteus TaxID=1138585 RepID=A0A2M9CCR7_9CELL|nr:Rieske (2Fe-2S) protein [Sediminihabitans luteus]PJJ69103.1 nitrite reductase/ring-hydroxylating ferredoxin subunit [Sediminihabitans luteus]
MSERHLTPATVQPGGCAAHGTPRGLTRRTLLATSGAGAGALVLAACAGTSGESADQVTQASDDAPLVAVADVPVGGAVSVRTAQGAPLLVTQPADGEIHVFGAICPHQGCTVLPDDAQLRCPCHASLFALTDGAVLEGPSPEPLPEVEVEVVDGQVRLP